MTAHAQPATAHQGTATAAAATAHAAAVKTIQGTLVQTLYGPLQVTIKVSGKKVTSVTATAPTERPRSAFINQHAVPILDREALSAQSAKIHLVAGASYTSRAFVSSLAYALSLAHV